MNAAADDQHVVGAGSEPGQIAGRMMGLPAVAPQRSLGAKVGSVIIVSSRVRSFVPRQCGRPRLLEPAHPRSGDHDAPGRFAGVLRGSRSVPLREAAPPAAAGGLRRVSRTRGARSGVRRRHRPGPLRPRRRDRDRGRSVGVGDRAGAAEFLTTGPHRRSARGRWRAAPVRRCHVRPGLRPRRRAVHQQPVGADSRMPPGPQAGRRGGVPGLQPHLLAECVVEADEGRRSNTRTRPSSASTASASSGRSCAILPTCGSSKSGFR